MDILLGLMPEYTEKADQMLALLKDRDAGFLQRTYKIKSLISSKTYFGAIECGMLDSLPPNKTVFP